MAGTAGTPHSPLPQWVDSIRWVCGTAASSSSPTLTWGGAQHQPPPRHSPAGGCTEMGDDAATSKCSQPCCRSIPWGSSPSGLPLVSPTPEKPMTSAMLRHRAGLHRVLGGPPTKLPQGHQLWHLPAAHGCSGSPIPICPLSRPAREGRCPRTSCPGCSSGQVAMAEPVSSVAGRGCREWHRLRRGMGSSISIAPPWAGTAAGAPTAPSSQARPPWVLGGRTSPGGDTGGESQAQLLPGCQDVKDWQSTVGQRVDEAGPGGLHDHHHHHQPPWAEHTAWLQPRRTFSPGKHLYPRTKTSPVLGQRPPPPWDKDLLHPATPQILSSSPPWSTPQPP